MKQTDPQFKLRIPEALRDQVMSAAKANKRSATAEIIARLEESFAPMSHRIVRAVEPATQGDEADLDEIQLNLGIILEQVKRLAATKPNPKLGRPLGIDQDAWAAHLAKENDKK